MLSRAQRDAVDILTKLHSVNRFSNVMRQVQSSDGDKSRVWPLRAQFTFSDDAAAAVRGGANEWSTAVALCIQRIVLYDAMCEARLRARVLELQYTQPHGSVPALSSVLELAQRACERAGFRAKAAMMSAGALGLVVLHPGVRSKSLKRKGLTQLQCAGVDVVVVCPDAFHAHDDALDRDAQEETRLYDLHKALAPCQLLLLDTPVPQALANEYPGITAGVDDDCACVRWTSATACCGSAVLLTLVPNPSRSQQT